MSPKTDDRPFFFNTVKPAAFLRPWEDKPGCMGVQVLAQLVLVVGLLVALFMIVPLYARRRSVLAAVAPGPRWATLLYFAALGAGFMLIEVSLISKFVLFLGHPIYALTVVLCSLLVAAGCGSYWSGRHVGAGHGPLRRVIAVALGAIVLLALVLDLVFTRLLTGAPFGVAATLTVLALAPTGFLMGMPFPLGLRLLDRMGPQWGELVPWVWGINGATSVLGSVLAISIALNVGFVATLLVGLVFYGVAFVTAGSLAGGALPVQETIPLRQRTIEGVEHPRPEAIVLSSAAKKGITHHWNLDWRKGHTPLVESPRASAFLAALEAQQLPYRRAAAFSQHPTLLRVRITSLCPTISIFRRVSG